ncbi:MAG: phosphatase [Saccharofermentanales bacterium]|nr:phosphatase [Clostridiaceae bacterium]
MTKLFDTHTHTIVSGHAFSTLEEYVAACKRLGLEGFATTEHGPAMIGSTDLIYFYNLVALPRLIDGIRVLRGVEANIIGHDGSLDLPESALKRLDLCIASYHEITLPPAGKAEHTEAWLAVIDNPLVDILGHIGRGPFLFDVDTVLKACKQNNKVLEINNHTLSSGFMQHNCLEIAKACRRHGVLVAVNSDAHFSGHLGEVSAALKLLNEIDFPEELIINRDYSIFSAWLKERKPWISDL